MNLQDIFNNIGNFFINLYQSHFALIIAIIVVFVALIVLLALLMRKRNKIEKQEAEIANKQAITQLTTQEIENISKNVSNPSEFREIVKTETTPTEEVAEEKVETLKEVAVTEVKEEKPTTTKKTTAKKKEKQPEPEVVEAQNKRVYTGKWKISKDENGYFAKLHASNGGMLLKTEYYTTLSGVKSGIETIKKNVESGNFAISIDKHNHYHFKLFSKANKLICVSEDYSSKAKCDSGISSVKRFANSSTIILEETND